MWKRSLRPRKLSDALELFLIVSCFGIVFLMGVVQPLDGDTWWHLRAGEVTFEQKIPLETDKFSYTKFGESWKSNAWLTELWLYVTYKVAGFTGISAWIALLTVVTLAMAFQLMDGPPVYKCTLVLAASLLLLPYLKARPQMVSFAFLTLTAWILEKHWSKKESTIFLLIPVFVLWANLHGGFIIGLVYILLYLMGDIITRFWHGGPFPRNELILRKRLFIIVIVCMVVVMINPFGLNVWTNLYHTMSVDSLNTMIVEWASLDFHDMHQQLYLWMMVVVMAVLGLSPRRIEWTDLLLLIFFTVSGFIWRRNTSFLVIFAMIILSKYLWPLVTMIYEGKRLIVINTLRDWWKGILSLLDQNTPRLVNVLLLFLSIVFYAGGVVKLYLLTTSEMIRKLESRQFPVAARQWIETNKPVGNMLNSYNWGGYFDWYLRDYPVFLDGRTDLFGDEIISQWLDVVNATGDWQAILDRWNVNFIVIEPGWRIAQLLPFHGWTILYQDRQSVIFGRAGK